MHRSRTAIAPRHAPSQAHLATALDQLREGRAIVVRRKTDPTASVLLAAGHLATAETLSFLVRNTSGFVRVAMPVTRSLALGLPPQVARPEGLAEDQCVTVDAAEGISTGISAADRARTIQLLANPNTHYDDLRRPGHIVPVRIHDEHEKDCHSFGDAAVRLMRLAGLNPCAYYAELQSQNDPRHLAPPEEALQFAQTHGVPYLDLEDLARPIPSRLAV